MPEGFSLNISAEILKKLDAADEKLQRIATHSEEVSKNMKKLSTDGINSVVRSLTEMNTHLTTLSKNNGLSSIGTQASQSVDAINKMIAALAQLTTQQQLRLQTQQSKLDYKKEANDIKELTIAENERARALDRQNKANIANDKHKQALETKKLANDTKELMNIEQERGRQLILQNQKSIVAYTKQSVKLKQQIDEVNRLAKAYRQLPKSIKQGELNKLITSASKAKTINQHIVAIHNLNNALRDLDTKSAKYKDNVRRINDEIARNRIELAKLGVNLDSVRNKKRKLMDTAGQLGRSLALVFSVSHIMGYVNQMVNIRREMELQHRSLQVLIQDRYEADKLWQQTVDLAVRSPFRVKELVTYTRQLAAYRIETDKLHDTTRRLADVSSGLGVDMNRLILAYGQVRAAEYLRGTELRQFSEAGIPMLDELAKYFSKLEDRAVSAGDVFERVSKRMVSFEDVNEVFQRMTNKGGVFFQMQEKQSETLHGIISNFHDSIDLMLNDLGAANDGMLKGTVLLFRDFVQNWRLFAEILTQIGTVAVIALLRKQILNLLALSPKIYAMAGSLASFNVVSRALNISIIRFVGSLKALGAAMLTPHGILIGFVATLASAISGFMAWQKAIDASNEKYDQLSEREANSIRNLQEINDAIKENNSIIKDNIADVEAKTKAEKDNEEQLETLKSKYPDVYKGLVLQKDGTIDATKAIEQHNKMLRINIALQQQAKGGMLQEDFSTNYQDALKKYQDVVSSITKVQSQALRSIVGLTSALQDGDISEETFKSLSELFGRFSKAETFDDIKRLNDEFAEFQKTLLSNQDEYIRVIKLTDGLRGAYSGLFKAQSNYSYHLENWFDNIDNQMDSFVVGARAKLESVTDENLGKTLAGDWITEELKKLGAVNEELLKKAQEYVQSKLSDLKIGITFAENGDPVYNLEEHWRKQIWDAIEQVQSTNPDIRLGVTLKEMATKDRSELIKKLQDSVNNAMKINDETIEVGKLSMQVAFTDEQIDAAERAKPLLEFLANLVGVIEKTNTRGSYAKDWISEVVKSIRDAHKEYLSLNKTLDDASAKEMTLAKYANLFKEAAQNTQFKDMNLDDFDFSTEEGTIQALEDMLNELPESAKKARLSIQKALTEIRGERVVTLKVEEDKALLDKIEDMFSGYEMSIELQKLNIPPDLAKQLFNVDSVDLSSIRSKIESDLAKARILGGQEDLIKELEKQLEKVEDLENKAQQERLKKYTKYLLKAQSERVKIKMEELRQIAEIEKENAYTDSQKETIKRNLQIETQEKIDKQAWDDFKNSEMYTQMFSDLEHLGTESIKRLKSSLESLKESLSELPASDLKEIMQQISKLEELEIERNPFASMRDAMKEVDELKKKGRTEKFVQEELATTQARIDSSKAEVDAINVVLNARKEGLSLETQSAEWQDNYRHLIMASNEELQNRLNYLERSVEKDKKIAQQAGIDAEAYVKARKATKGFTDNVSKWGEAIKEVLGGVDEVLDAFGVAEDDTARLWVNNAMQIADMIVQVVILTASLHAMGIAANSALGVIGWIAMALQAVAMIFASIFSAGDKRKERQIQREMDLVSDLEQAYKKLERAIDNAYSIDTLERSGANAKRNIQAQISSYYRMIEAEEDKKKTDKDRIKEWEQTIDDLKMELEDLNKELVSTATSGIMDSVLSASQEFTDAWLEAFNETGDGLSGLESNFKETMLEMVKQQAAMLISQAYVDRWKNQLEQYINPDDLELSTDEAKRWVNAVTTSLPQLNEALEKYFTAMQQAGVDLGGGSDSELSGLQRGIQSVSESTAQIIEAYLNSVRFYVADSNTKLTQLVNQVVGGENTPNPILSELKTQTELVRGISTLLNSVVRGSHSMGGQGIKVFIS